jgi:hypothetical protein
VAEAPQTVEVGGGDASTPQARPKVVVIVAPREQAAAAAPAKPAAAPPAEVRTPVADDVHDAGDLATDVSAPAPPRATAPAMAEPDRPTERIRKAAKRPRTAEDDRLIAAVIPIDLTASPGPLTDFLGCTLLFRAARAALAANAPRLILLGKVPDARQRELYDEAYRGFGGRPVEVRAGDPGTADFGRGRVLILDGAALHDPAAVTRLAQSKGEATTLLLSRNGEGVRVRTEDGRIREVGVDHSSSDGVMAGAASVPVEHFEKITQLGQQAVLEELSSGDQLMGLMARRSYAQQLHSRDACAQAQVSAYDAIASGDAVGLFEDVIGKPISRAITAFMLHRPSFTPSRVSIGAGVLALVGAFLMISSGEVPPSFGALFLALAGLFLVGSAILDRTDGELARLRMDDDEEARSLDFGLDHVAHMVVFAALAWAVEPPDLTRSATAWGHFLTSAPAWLLEPLHRYQLDDPMRLGMIAVSGVVFLMCVLLVRGAPRGESRGIRRLADGLASAFNSRDYFYLLTLAALFNLIPQLAAKGLMAYFLVGTAALVHLTWITILLLTLASPAPAED